MKSLALAAGLMMATSANATITSTKVSSGDLVISKVFYAASKKASGSGNYMAGQYIEIYNNREEEVEISGLYLALLESESASAAYTQATIEADAELKSKLSGKLVVKQIFQIPTDQTYTIAPGKSVIICNSAIDHTANALVGHDLSGADFEVKTTNTNYPHNDAVPAINLVYTMTPTLDFMNLSYTGLTSAGVVLLKNNASAIVTAEESLLYGYGKTTGNKFALVNPYYAIDMVEIIGNKANGGVDATLKRVTDTYDAGIASTTATGGYNGETVYRKTAFVMPDGRKVLYDTNNSTVDFVASSTIQPRAFDDELAGITESTITIPASGFLFFQPEKPFYGEENVLFTFVTGSANASTTDLIYNEYKGNEQLLASSNFFAIGAPGEYKVYYSDAQATKKIPSNLLSYSAEDAIDNSESSSLKTRRIYKFLNTSEKTGFQRVPATTDGKYNKATFSDGDRVYINLTENILNRIYEANGAASIDDLEFITWHGTMPTLTAVKAVSENVPAQDAAIYNVQGMRLSGLQKGINIVNGQKIVTE